MLTYLEAMESQGQSAPARREHPSTLGSNLGMNVGRAEKCHFSICEKIYDRRLKWGGISRWGLRGTAVVSCRCG